METKLTLKLDKNVIKQVKIYAKRRNVSLSKMVENYFISITEEKKTKKEKFSPIVRELSGIIDLNDNKNNRDNYTDYLIEKYK